MLVKHVGKKYCRGEKNKMSKRSADKQITKDNAELSGSCSESEIAVPREKAPDEVIAVRKIVSVKRSGSGNAPQQKTETPPLEETVASPKAKSLFGGLSSLSAKPTISAAPDSPLKFSGLTKLSPVPEKAIPEKVGLFSSLFSETAVTSFAGFTPAAFPSFGQESGESREQTPEESSEEEEIVPGPAQQDHSEDSEELVLQTDCKLFRLLASEDGGFKWTEKGIGFVRLIKSKDLFRIVVRMKGVYRLLLSAGLVDGVAKVEKVGNKSVKFNALDEEGKLAQFRLNLLTEDQQSAFMKHFP